jgi:hypothetical protein
MYLHAWYEVFMKRSNATVVVLISNYYFSFFEKTSDSIWLILSSFGRFIKWRTRYERIVIMCI